jgi:hypothetical protein
MAFGCKEIQKLLFYFFRGRIHIGRKDKKSHRMGGFLLFCYETI